MKSYFPIHLNGGNRGCEAISKGTALILKEKKENLIGLCTNIELDHRLKVDEFVTLYPMRPRNLISCIRNKLYSMVESDEWKRKQFSYRYEYMSFLNQLKEDDIMLSTGGDMMCYQENQVIYTVNYLYKRGIRSILWGCSIGENNITPLKLKALKQFSLIYARETLTQEVLANYNINNVVVYPDPAFVLEPIKCQLPKCFSLGQVVGINLSNYVMGGFALNTEFAKEVDDLIKHILLTTDNQILLIPHVLWKGQDDRIISNLIKEKYHSDRISILDSNSLNYCQIRFVISKCRCFIGARTHSVISAYSTCTPAIALGYSIKSKGIAKDLNMPQNTVVNSANIKKGELINAFSFLSNNENELRNQLKMKIDKYTKRTWNILEVKNKI